MSESHDLTIVMRQAWPYHRALASASALMTLESTSGLMLPLLGGKLAQSLIQPTGPVRSIEFVFLGMAGLLAFQAGLAFGRGWLQAATADRMSSDLRVRLHDHAQALPLG